MKHLRQYVRQLLLESIPLDIKVGDVILTGKFKNKRKVVKSIGKDKYGQPTINGKSILKFKIEKHLPKKSWSAKSKEELKESNMLLEGKGMMTPDDLPEGAFVEIQDKDETFTVMIRDPARDFTSGVMGYIKLRKALHELCLGAWEVQKSNADHGWGPFIYDIAMEYVGEEGIMCDRSSVREDTAAKVWDFYLHKRSDVKAIQLDDNRWPFLLDPKPNNKKDDCPQRTFARHQQEEMEKVEPDSFGQWHPKKFPKHKQVFLDHWSTKKYVKTTGSPIIDELEFQNRLVYK